MHQYIGRRLGNGSTLVLVVDAGGERELPIRRDLKSYATRFDWGYAAAAPTQLSLALLADAVGDHEAVKLHHRFLWLFVASWARDGFALTDAEVRDAVRKIREERTF